MSRAGNTTLVLLTLVCSTLTLGCASLESFTTGDADQVARKGKAPAAEDFDSKLVRGRSLERSGDWDKAAKIYDDLLEERGDDWRVHHRAAVAADNQKRFKLAQQRYTRAIQLNPKNAELFNDLGYCLYLQGHLSKAESAMAKAVALESGNSKYRNNLGMVLGQQGRIEEAFKQFAQAGSEADAFYNVAFVYASNDDEDAALECFQLALDSDPTHKKARAALTSFAREDDGDALAPSEGRLVRYEEDGQGDGATTQADFSGALPDNRSAGQATRRLYQRARQTLDQRLGSQNSASLGAQNAATP